VRSKTVSRRGLIVGTAACVAAPAPERHCFVITVPRLSGSDIEKIRGFRHGWTLTIHGGIEAKLP